MNIFDYYILKLYVVCTMNEIYRSPIIYPYDRSNAVNYAHHWAYKRNPLYLDFQNIGGDCTNFASQVIFAGSGVMNFLPTFGWYYLDSSNRTPSWSGVNFLYNFLIGNTDNGPFAKKVDIKDIKPGDIIQLSFIGGNIYHHTPVVVETGNPPSMNNILVATHTFDHDNYPLSNYTWEEIRFIHILGVRK